MPDVCPRKKSHKIKFPGGFLSQGSLGIWANGGDDFRAHLTSGALWIGFLVTPLGTSFPDTILLL